MNEFIKSLKPGDVVTDSKGKEYEVQEVISKTVKMRAGDVIHFFTFAEIEEKAFKKTTT